MNPIDPIAFSEYLFKKAAVNTVGDEEPKGRPVGRAQNLGSRTDPSDPFAIKAPAVTYDPVKKQVKLAGIFAADPVELADRILESMYVSSKQAGAAPVAQGPAPQTAVPLTQAQQNQQSEQDMSMHVARLQNLSPDGSNVDGGMFESAASMYGEVDDNGNHPAYPLLQQAMPALGMAVGLDLSDPTQASTFDAKMKEMGRGLTKAGPAESAAWKSILSDQNRLAGFFAQGNAKGNGKR